MTEIEKGQNASGSVALFSQQRTRTKARCHVHGPRLLRKRLGKRMNENS